jgi:dienelactone hydrolase
MDVKPIQAEGRRIAMHLFAVAACLCLPLTAGCVHQHYTMEQSCSDHDVEHPALTPVNYRWPQQQQAVLEPQLVPAEPLDDAAMHTGTKHKISRYLVSNMQSKKLQHYQVQELQYPSSGRSGQPGNSVRVRFYQGDVTQPAPLVIILPIWGTFDYPVEKLSLRLRKHFKGKVHIALVLGEQRLVQWPEIAASSSREELLLHSQVSAEQVGVAREDTRGLLRWAQSQPQIDAERIVLSGFSIGAIVGSMVAVEEPTLAGTTLVMGAVNPAEVLAFCNRIAGDSRDKAMATLGMDIDEYEDIMHRAFDSLDWTRRDIAVNDPARFLLVDANNDDCMPQQTRDALWLGLGKPERYTLRGNHQEAFLSMTLVGLNQTSKILIDYIEQRVMPHNTAQAKAANTDEQGSAPCPPEESFL